MKATMTLKPTTRPYVNKQADDIDWSSLEITARVFMVDYLPHKDVAPVELMYFLVLPNGAVVINHRDVIDEWDFDEDNNKSEKTLLKPAYNLKTQRPIYNMYKIMNNVQLYRDTFIDVTLQFNPVSFTFVETRNPKFTQKEACDFIVSKDGRMQTFLETYIDEKTNLRYGVRENNYTVTDLGEWNII